MSNQLKWSLLGVFVIFLLIAVAAWRLTGQPDDSEAAPTYFMTRLDPEPVTDFSLPASTGTDFTLSKQRDKIVILYFGYTSCPDFCPTTLGKLAHVYEQLGDAAEGVQVVFVTGDLERDTLERVTRYMEGFDSRFIGVVPPSQADLDPLLDQFGAVITRVETPNSALQYTIQHTTALFIIDQQGRYVGRMGYSATADEVVHDLRLLLDS